MQQPVDWSTIRVTTRQDPLNGTKIQVILRNHPIGLQLLWLMPQSFPATHAAQRFFKLALAVTVGRSSAENTKITCRAATQTVIIKSTLNMKEPRQKSTKNKDWRRNTPNARKRKSD